MKFSRIHAISATLKRFFDYAPKFPYVGGLPTAERMYDRTDGWLL
jgi:hypothetical protein